MWRRLGPGSAFSKLCRSVLPSMAMRGRRRFPLIESTMEVKTRRNVSSLGSLRRLRSQGSRALAKRSKSSKPALPKIMAAEAMKMSSPK
jgi:hypothetical protein